MSGYLLPRLWAGGWIIAAGACVCVIYNLASRHGVLAPDTGGNAAKTSVRPMYGVSSTVDRGRVEKAEVKRKKAVFPKGEDKGPDIPVAASAYVMVKNAPPAASGSSPDSTGTSGVESGAPAGLTVITLAEATKYLESGSVVFVDARSAQRFEMGHVPGALNVPAPDFDNGYARNAARLPKDGKIIVYCESANCDQAEDVANKLIQKGHRKVLHYKDGWLVWEFSDMVQEKGAQR